MNGRILSVVFLTISIICLMINEVVQNGFNQVGLVYVIPIVSLLCIVVLIASDNRRVPSSVAVPGLRAVGQQAPPLQLPPVGPPGPEPPAPPPDEPYPQYPQYPQPPTPTRPPSLSPPRHTGDWNAQGNGEECSICYEMMDQETREVVVCPCKHEYHHRCLLEWFKRGSSCPLCNRVFTLDFLEDN
jgi:hypothetical protein